MADQNTIFGGMLTKLGAAKKTYCDAMKIPWEPQYMLIGDADGTDPVPNASQTSLIHEVYRAELNLLYVSPQDNNVLVAELVLPPEVGGWWIRELAIEDKDGVFSAVANVAPSYKPLLTQGTGRNQVLRMHIIINGTANIQLKIDPSVVLATREYVDIRVNEDLYKQPFKQSVLVATTADTPLKGSPVIDGFTAVAGSRVLVKNQVVPADNGIYVAAGGDWKRAPDADTVDKVAPGMFVPVDKGLTQADTNWQLVTNGPITLGVSPLTFQNIINGLAPLKSPKFLEIPTAPTAPSETNSDQIATTAFARRAANPAAPILQTPSFVMGFVDNNGGSSLWKYDSNVFLIVDVTNTAMPTVVTTMSVLSVAYAPAKEMAGVGIWTQGTANKGFFCWRLSTAGALLFEFVSGTSSSSDPVRFRLNVAFNKL